MQALLFRRLQKSIPDDGRDPTNDNYRSQSWHRQRKSSPEDQQPQSRCPWPNGLLTSLRPLSFLNLFRFLFGDGRGDLLDLFLESDVSLAADVRSLHEPFDLFFPLLPLGVHRDRHSFSKIGSRVKKAMQFSKNSLHSATDLHQLGRKFVETPGTVDRDYETIRQK
jgi:hypothetical protein